MPKPATTVKRGVKQAAGGGTAADARPARRIIATGAKGARFERQVRDYLWSQGYGVTRATGSLGVADLWAAMSKCNGHGGGTLTELLIVECRSGHEHLRSDADRHDLLSLADRTGGIPLLACNEKGKPGGIRFRRILTAGYEEYAV